MIPVSVDRYIRKAEYWMVGTLDDAVRYNMRWEFVSSLFVGVFYSLVSFLSVVLRNLGADASLIAFFNVLSYIGISLTWISLIIIRRGVSPRNLFLICSAIGRCSILVVLFLPNITGLLIFAIIYYICISMIGPAYNMILQVVYPSQSRGKAMALVRLGFALTLLLFSPIIGWLLDEIGFQYLFPVGAIMGVISVYALAKMKMAEAEVPIISDTNTRSVWTILQKERHLWVYLVILVAFGLGALIPITLYPIIQVDDLQLTYSQIGFLTLAQNVTWFVGFFLSGRIVDKLGGLRTMLISIFMHGIIALPYLWAQTGWGLIISFLAAGFAYATFEIGVSNALIELSKPGEIIQTSSIHSVVIGLRGLIGPYIGVWMVKAGLSYNIVIWVSVGLILFASILMWLYISKIKKNPSTKLV